MQLKCYSNFVLLGLIFCFLYLATNQNRHDTKSTVYFDPRAPDTRIKSPYLFITCLLCIAKYRFFFSKLFYAYIPTIFFASFATRRDHPSILWGTKCSKIKIYDNKWYDVYTDYISYMHMHVLIQGITTTERNSMNLYTKINRFIFLVRHQIAKLLSNFIWLNIRICIVWVSDSFFVCSSRKKTDGLYLIKFYKLENWSSVGICVA